MLLQQLRAIAQMRKSELKVIPTGVRASVLFILNESLSLTPLNRLELFAKQVPLQPRSFLTRINKRKGKKNLPDSFMMTTLKPNILLPRPPRARHPQRDPQALPRDSNIVFS